MYILPTSTLHITNLLLSLLLFLYYSHTSDVLLFLDNVLPNEQPVDFKDLVKGIYINEAKKRNVRH